MSYRISVRGLCEFAAKQGDLDLRFSPAPSAQEGIAGHAIVTQRRAPGYQTEVSLSATHSGLLVRGRADGFDPEQNLIEEIKTHRSALNRLPDNQRALHWAQLHCYGHMMCQERSLSSIDLALVYFDIGPQTETVLRVSMSAEALAAVFAALCEDFSAWAEQEVAHRTERDGALKAMNFPRPQFRQGQRDLAEAVYASSAKATCLLAQAPTGIGKTLGTLFPALKSMPCHGLDKVFCLSAKTPGRTLALETASSLCADQAVRVVELVARDKACVHPDKACHGESCPLARGFYDRLPAARAAAVQRPCLSATVLAEIGQTFDVCPYYLGAEMARWGDLLVGDYNYYFDHNGMLFPLSLEHQWKVHVLVDEAHNLVGRARGMYSLELRYGLWRMAAHDLPAKLSRRLSKAWKSLSSKHAYEVLPAPPSELVSQVQELCSALTDMVAADVLLMSGPLQEFYFDALQFLRLAESFGEHSMVDVSVDGDISIRNIVPAPFLAPRFKAAHACTLFSATLSPWHFYADALGLPESTCWLDVASPFQADQLSIRLARHISTRYRDRAASVAPIVRLIAETFAEQPGNYLAFFSSFEYLDLVATALTQACPDIPVWRQSRAMNETARADFVERFQGDSAGIGFAVLGGAFSEGIDLPGRRLIGAFIATLGLPQFNPVNEQFRARMQSLFGAGFEYTYLYPGIQKVVQAAGRVIRAETDQGIIYLIDERFDQAQVRALLPAWWATE